MGSTAPTHSLIAKLVPLAPTALRDLINQLVALLVTTVLKPKLFLLFVPQEAIARKVLPRLLSA